MNVRKSAGLTAHSRAERAGWAPVGQPARAAATAFEVDVAQRLQGAASACVTVRRGALSMAWRRVGDC